ncbi:MAG TPA: sigma-54 dependent transcriptional regulator [Candidatus Binatia bacterium]|jgi:two-component system response regulator GlrR|nr:sigma-54 dependent transcriptional regulator [Candidatus Binatia bacterium]
MSAGNLLVVDDDQNLIELIALKLKAEGYEVTTAGTGQEAVQAAKAAIFDLCIVDLRLSDQDGISVMRELHSINPGMRVIILTGYGTVESAVQAMQEGAYSYLSKPFNTQELLLQISRALENRRLNSEIQRLKGLLEQAYDFPNIVAKSAKMRSVLDIVSRIADTESTIYLQGESGTGKELIAKAIYLASSRRDKPFVAVNCAALPEPLLESELFGHEKGSFTGADRSTRGLLSQANNGTFFLDEIGDMPLSIQAKLLRALQDKQFYPVGSEKPLAVNVRIIVATNKNLEEEVAKGNFRLDLFYRLHVIPIHLPPLRERKEDIPLLADRFLKQISQQMKKKIKGITPEAMRKLMLYDWPGNVRELENTLEYAVAMTRHDMLTEDSILHTKGTAANSRQEDLATFGNGSKGPVKSYKSAKYEFEKGYLVHLLKLCGGKASEAAKLAGKSRTDFYELLRKHEIRIDDFRRNELMQG